VVGLLISHVISNRSPFQKMLPKRTNTSQCGEEQQFIPITPSEHLSQKDYCSVSRRFNEVFYWRQSRYRASGL